MSTLIHSLAAPCVLLSLAIPAAADTITQQGSIIGAFAPVVQTDIILSQFDTFGGSRQLNFVQLDFIATLNGTYRGTGSGDPVDVFALMGASYDLGDHEFAFTLALFDGDIDDDTPGPGTLDLSDSAQVILDQPADLAPWIGPGSITLTAYSQLDFSTIPADAISFSATGFAQYAITYEYSLVPAPVPLALLPALLLASRRRRTH